MKINIFLSYPREINKIQKLFIKKLKNKLKEMNINPMTLGVSNYNYKAPLIGIRQLMIEANGLICVALKRTFIKEGEKKDINGKNEKLDGKWLTSPYCQIEPAMAFQLGLPILIFREKDVLSDGILEKGVTGLYMPEINLESKDLIDIYLESDEFKSILKQWEQVVRNVYYTKTMPPYYEINNINN